ncbi:coagulation factor XIII A chain-like [Neoarius graeffei]|uniref:coagulation factor XIII A chain-like n=1 Tax=Neoarius graeffei TaxID=443677 RepID=UPI00298D3981|nr:coagulation factor XIII A chain-like [Neoarius graeffei]
MPIFDPCEQNQGRLNNPVSCSNIENSILPEFEAFDEAQPRTYRPSGDDLIVKHIYMHKTTNKVAHHTDAYSLSNLIVRRAQEFIMSVVFNRTFNPHTDLMVIEFLIGNNPSNTQHTLISLSYGTKQYTSDWEIRAVETNNTWLKMGITPAADCIVGLYSTYVSVITNFGKQRSQRNQNTDFYVLFNPWAQRDQVFLDSDQERQEYVLNDVGIMYTGVYNNIGRRPWNYGQFQDSILEACIFILDFGKMPLQFRGDAIKVARKASSLINSLDGNGVLVGSWDDDYGNGTSPSAWTGSVEILRQYFSENGVPVMYAQCWVYAGVFNTFLRCLGLPARVITNYCSAHDNGGDLMTNIVLDEDGSLNKEHSDTIWNFHCWNEVFLRRDDIPNRYSGWQVVDATPQEISDGYFRCGPAAVAAIKEKALSYPFDAKFVFSEVNSDVVFSQIDKYGNMKTIYVNTTYVGKLIVTKMIGSDDYANMTDTYKYKSVSRRQNETQQKEIEVQLYIQVLKSGDLMLTMTFTNLTSDSRTITCKIPGRVEYYTGATRTQFILLTHEVALQPLESKQEVITVTEDKYKSFIIGRSFLSFIVYAFIHETTVSVTTMESICLETPPLLIEVSNHSQVGKDMFAIMSFTNTLGYDLTNVTLRIEGLGLFPVKTKIYR